MRSLNTRQQGRLLIAALACIPGLLICCWLTGAVAGGWLKQSTGCQVIVGPFVDTATAATPSTALAIAPGDVWLSKNGAAPATKNQAGNCTHRYQGFYAASFNTTDTNTLGRLDVMVKESGYLIVWDTFMVVTANMWDSLVGGTDTLQADMTQIQGTAPSTDTAGVLNTNASQIESADPTDTIRDSVVDDATRIDASALNTASGAVGSNGSGLTEAGGTGDHLTAVPWNSAWDAEVQSECNDALVAMFTSSAALVDAVWDEVLTGATHNVANSAGRRLRQIEASFVVASGTAQAGGANTITLEAGASATNDIYAGDRVVIVGGTGIGEHGIITTYNGTTKVATMSQNWVVTPDATSEYELAPADVDVETWQHVTVTLSGTTNKPEVDVNSLSDDATAANNAELAFDGTGYGFTGCTVPTVTTLTGHTAQTGDSFARLGAPAGASVSADIAAIEAQTDDIGVAGAGLTAIPWNSAWDAEVESECTDALNVYDPPTNAEMVARTLLAAGYFDPAADTVANVTTVATLTGHTPQTADHAANVAAILTDTGTTLPATLTTILADTNELQTNQGNWVTATGFPTAAQMADAVWNEARTGHTTAGTFGRYLDAQITTRATPADVRVIIP